MTKAIQIHPDDLHDIKAAIRAIPANRWTQTAYVSDKAWYQNLHGEGVPDGERPCGCLIAHLAEHARGKAVIGLSFAYPPTLFRDAELRYPRVPPWVFSELSAISEQARGETLEETHAAMIDAALRYLDGEDFVVAPLASGGNGEERHD